MGNSKTKVKSEETSTATAKTVNNIFSEMNNTFNWFKTKDPQQIVKNILEADFGNSGSDVSDQFFTRR